MNNTVCGQINTPTVDESQSMCDVFPLSQCVLVSYKSSYVKNRVGISLDEYLKLLDDRLNKMSNQYLLLTRELDSIKQQVTPDGIGVFSTP